MTVLPALAFAETRTHLERRILAMSQPRPSRPVIRALSALSIAATVIVIACEAPRPTAPLTPKAEYSWSAGGARDGNAPVSDSTDRASLTRFVKQVIGERHPDIARGEGGDEPVMIVVDDNGAVVGSARMAGASFRTRMKQTDTTITVRAGASASGGASDGSGPPPQRARRSRTVGDGVPDMSATMPAEPDLAQRLVPADISSVNVLKLQAGEIAPQRVGAVVVRLKPGATLKPEQSPR
jgi:hypothetical protein